MGLELAAQLFDLSSDLGEKNNLAGKYPECANRMQMRLNTLRGADRSH